MIDLAWLNALPQDEFTATLGGIFEHSPWVAERAAAGRPYATVEHMHQAMCAVVAAAAHGEQMALIQAHPRLGARGRQRQELTASSASEQRRAGLDALSDEQFAELLRLNAQYEQRFGFPFILAVRGHSPDSILAAMRSRLGNDLEAERRTALEQIARIAGLRLADAVKEQGE